MESYPEWLTLAAADMDIPLHPAARNAVMEDESG
jgi:hypothetical protein